MRFGEIPPDFTRLQRQIVIVWLEERTVTRTAERLAYKSPSFVRKVVHEYRQQLTASSEAMLSLAQ